MASTFSPTRFDAKEWVALAKAAGMRYITITPRHHDGFSMFAEPRPDGTIQPEAAERLRDIGRWLGTYGRSIYGTRAGPVPPRRWGVTTQRGDTVFVHVLD